MSVASTTPFNLLARRPGRRAAVAMAAVLATLAVPVATVSVQADAVDLQIVNATSMATQAERTLASYRAWQDSRQPMAWVEYVDQRDQFAADLSQSLGTDADALTTEWASAPIANQVIVLSALTQLGTPYRFNSMSPDSSFDCSGLTKWAYSQAGVDLPRVSWDQIRSAERVDRDSATPGDLVHYPGHIGLYLGQGGFIDAPNTGNVVRVQGLPGRSLRFGDATPT